MTTFEARDNFGGNIEGVTKYLNELENNGKKIEFLSVLFIRGYRVVVGYKE